MSDDQIRHVGGGWYEVDTGDGAERVRGREAAEELRTRDLWDRLPDEVECTTEIVDTGESTAFETLVPAGKTITEAFSGPAMTLTISRDPEPSTLTAHGPRGHVPVRVEGRSVSRPDGHFGRGRWTATYQPA